VWSVMDGDLAAGTRILPQAAATITAPGQAIAMAARSGSDLDGPDLDGLLRAQAEANAIRFNGGEAGHRWLFGAALEDRAGFLRQSEGHGIAPAAGHMDLLTALTQNREQHFGFDHAASPSAMANGLEEQAPLLPQEAAAVAAPGKTISMAARETLVFDEGQGVFRDLLQGVLTDLASDRAAKGLSTLTDRHHEEDPFWLIEV